MMELVSRVKALLRRGGQEQPQDDEEYVLGELYVSKKRHLVKVKGEEVTLTMKEFELLLLFLSIQGLCFPGHSFWIKYGDISLMEKAEQ